MISMKSMVCTRYPPTPDPPPARRWMTPQSLEPHHAPRMTDRQMYESLRSSIAKLPPPGACDDEKISPTRCGSAIEEVRKRVDTMMRNKPLVNCIHHPGYRDTVEGQLALSPEMAMGHFNTPCPHLRSRTAFDLTHNSPADKALRDRIRRCRLPPVTASCSRQTDGLVVCTFRNKPPYVN